MSFFIFFQLILVSVFSLLLFKELKFSSFISIFGAVVFTFNGFVTMRLSPGVGIEYLYSYKWIPLILLLTLVYFRERKISDLLLLSIPLAFTFEGNLNISISIWIFWGIFTLFMAGKSIKKELGKLFLVTFLAVSIYAIKLLPFMDLMKNSSGRISGAVSGWRINKIEFPSLWTYFPPIRHIFGAAIFTPGLIAFCFFIIFLAVTLFSIAKGKKIDRVIVFLLVSLLVGSILITYNPLSDLIFSLPFFNRITIIPSFLVFVFVPFYIMSVYGIDVSIKFISKFIKLKNWNLIEGLVVLGISLMVFGEVLLGPSTFGNKTYSFNFAKMDRNEIYKVPPYDYLKKLDPGVFMFVDSSDTFMYPYAISLSDLHTLNNFKYFYVSASDRDLVEDGGLEEIVKRVDYVLSTKPLNEDRITYLGDVGTARLFSDFSSHSILDKKYDYLDLQSENNWDEKLYVYSVGRSNLGTEFLKIKDTNPTKVRVSNIDPYLNDGRVDTSVRYSPWWVLKNVLEGKIKKDDFGFLYITGLKNTTGIDMYYFNPFIYIGFGISAFSFGYILYILVKKKGF